MHAVRKRGSALPSGFVHNLVSSGESSAFFNSDGTNCFSRQLTRMRVYFKPDATSASLRCAGKANRDHLGGRRREASFVRSHNPDARSEATWLSMKLRRKMDAGGRKGLPGLQSSGTHKPAWRLPWGNGTSASLWINTTMPARPCRLATTSSEVADQNTKNPSHRPK